MNVVDLLLGLVILFSVWMGWRRGAIAGFADLASWIGSLLIGFLFYKQLGSFMEGKFPSLSVWSNPFAFIFLLLVSRFILSVIISKFLPVQDAQVQEKPLNKAFGIIPGFVNGVMNAIIIAALLLLVPFSSTLTSTAKESESVTMLSSQLQWFDDKLVPIFDPALKKTIKDKAVYPDAKSTTRLNFKVPNAKVKQNLEYEMFDLVNRERLKIGLKTLQWEPSLLPAARNHSKDMFERGYFSHFSLEGKTVSDRLRSSKVRFTVAGENLALSQSIPMAHEGLMNSPGHKANILHKSYGRIAIGVLDGGFYGLMITQVFKD